MRIGVLTFYNNANFGANLQALSTYRYLLNNGHEPVFINYKSKANLMRWTKKQQENAQFKAHIEFVKKYIYKQTEFCSNTEELREILCKYKIEGIILGSDAVLQHHPLISRLKKGRYLPVKVNKYMSEMMYPNPFWGDGFSDIIPTAMMSVSSQNSEYMDFASWTKAKMRKNLQSMRYVSVRDTWTQKMIESITGDLVEITPDPVFAFNYNAEDTILSKEEIVKKYSIPNDYVLISLRGQCLEVAQLDEIKEKFDNLGLTCVALTMPEGVLFHHNFEHSIVPSLPSNDWYALIKYSSGYIGSNMHPIVVCLHNAVPCVSLDNWGRTNYFGNKINDGSSKVEHIMKEFGVGDNHHMINDGKCIISTDQLIKEIVKFPKQQVSEHSKIMLERYKEMMEAIITSLAK